MVFVLDKHKKPLGFTTEKRARQLMTARRACVYRYYPFVIIAKDVDAKNCDSLPTYRIKIDPGAQHTGIAIVENGTNRVMYFAQIEHRARAIRKAMETRKGSRRNRRSRETWYRRSKFADGGKFESSRPKGWLPPSIQSIIDNVTSIVKMFSRFANITTCSFEAVRFDTQLMDNPNIEGIEYQQGTLFGFELREYLLDKYKHTCQYCNGESGDDILEREHKQPKSRGGSDKLSNSTLSCYTCNRAKGAMTPEEWLEKVQAKKRKSKLDMARIEGIQRVIDGKISGSDRYCAWANATRKAEERTLFSMFGEVECASGGRTKFNRTTLGLPKEHCIDALCVGEVPSEGFDDHTGGYCLAIIAIGRGTRFRGKINKCGIITLKLKKRAKAVQGFMNGDIVVADAPDGKYAGHHIGRVMTRASGSFDIRCNDGSLVNVNARFCRVLQHNNGYRYLVGKLSTKE